MSDATIDRLYHPMLAPYDTVLIGLGESIKTLQPSNRSTAASSTGRRPVDFVLGIGGGIVTDVAGFAAATYMRGLDFGFVSTTLLGQVDASVGGKNGVNVDGYKNMAGTFSQPRFVICDPGMLRTLSDREFRAGLAEVVKAAIIVRCRPLRADRSHDFRRPAFRYRPAYGCRLGVDPREGRHCRTRRARVGRPPQAQPRAYAGARHREVYQPPEPRRGRGGGNGG